MNVTGVVWIWVILGIVTLGLALYRRLASNREEDTVALGPGEEGRIPQQVALAERLRTIDRWGVSLTIITAVLGLCLAGAFLYQAWQDPTSVPNNFYRRNIP